MSETYHGICKQCGDIEVEITVPDNAFNNPVNGRNNLPPCCPVCAVDLKNVHKK